LHQSSRDARYRAGAFAELAGVTVRTLHHYDRLGLLRAKRSGSGYRLYQAEDLERLEQIAALKFLGLSLTQIRQVLDGKPASLGQELARQRRAIREKRRMLDIALSSIEETEAAIREGKPTTVLLKRIIRSITMQNNTDWMMQYYSPAAQAKIAAKAASFSPDMQAEISEAWKEYFRDLNALKKEDDRDGSRAAELAQRHRQLIAAFTGNDPEIESGLAALYRDRENWPNDMQEKLAEYEKPDAQKT
jgi:DNA-binding transcriptional MerR regulator